MTVKEFSDQFDILANSYIRQYDPGIQDILAFNEYEKSLYLSKAQEEFVISCYDGKNQYGYLFEHTEEDRRMLDSLIRTKIMEPMVYSIVYENYVPLSKNSKFYMMPPDLLFITYESCDLKSDDKCIDNKNVIVVPTSQDEFYRTNNNPFRKSNDHRVLRLDYNGNIIELVSEYEIDKYIVRYISKPKPIILVDFPDGLQIDGYQYENGCQLAEFTHKRILDIAVRMALQNRSIGFNNNN